MEELLQLLNTIGDYRSMLAALQQGQSVAVTGIGQINRSHMIAGISRSCVRPMVIVCPDAMAARRLQEELKGFLGESAPILPSRELTLYDAAVVSRSWEQKRLRQLYDLAMEKTPMLLTSWEALSLRTIPKSTLLHTAFTLETGKEYSLPELIDRLTAAGYSRCGMVEGSGQFAIRGGIVDVFSPAADQPIRMEFFGDELDTMGYFDPVSQRRNENTDRVTILPVCETLPGLHPKGVEGLCQDLTNLISRQNRRKNRNDALISTLTKDLEKYENGLSNPASDRYMALIYPEMATAADYIPGDALVVVCDHSSLQRTARSRSEEMGMQLDGLLQGGLLVGELCDFVFQWEDFCKSLTGRTVVYFDAFGGTSYHSGIDIANSYGTDIVASDGGIVIYAGWMSGYGYLVQIDHQNGYVTYYGHNSSLLVSVGDKVYKGQHIAEMGSTGRSTGNHCHFEVRYNGERQNPLDYVSY